MSCSAKCKIYLIWNALGGIIKCHRWMPLNAITVKKTISISISLNCMEQTQGSCALFKASLKTTKEENTGTSLKTLMYSMLNEKSTKTIYLMLCNIQYLCSKNNEVQSFTKLQLYKQMSQHRIRNTKEQNLNKLVFKQCSFAEDYTPF